MIEKLIDVDRVEVVENGVIQIRTRITFVENGQQEVSKLHRHTIVPGDDYSNEDQKVQAVCSAIHTPEVIEAYQLSQQGV